MRVCRLLGAFVVVYAARRKMDTHILNIQCIVVYLVLFGVVFNAGFFLKQVVWMLLLLMTLDIADIYDLAGVTIAAVEHLYKYSLPGTVSRGWALR